MSYCMLLFKHGFGISYGIVIREYAGTRFLNQFLRPIVLLSHLPGPKPEVHLTDRRTHTHRHTHTHDLEWRPLLASLGLAST